MAALSESRGKSNPGPPLAVIPMSAHGVSGGAPMFAKRRRLDHPAPPAALPSPPTIPIATRPAQAPPSMLVGQVGFTAGGPKETMAGENELPPPLSLDIKTVPRENASSGQPPNAAYLDIPGRKNRGRKLLDIPARRVQFKSPIEEPTPERVREGATAKVKRSQSKRAVKTGGKASRSTPLKNATIPAPSTTELYNETTLHESSGDDMDRNSSPLPSFDSTPTGSDVDLDPSQAPASVPEKLPSPKWISQAPYEISSSDGSLDDMMQGVENEKDNVSDRGRGAGDKADGSEEHVVGSMPPRDATEAFDSVPPIMQHRIQGIADRVARLRQNERVSGSRAAISKFSTIFFTSHMLTKRIALLCFMFTWPELPSKWTLIGAIDSSLGYSQCNSSSLRLPTSWTIVWKDIDMMGPS